jgi:hypothetical protein
MRNFSGVGSSARNIAPESPPNVQKTTLIPLRSEFSLSIIPIICRTVP